MTIGRASAQQPRRRQRDHGHRTVRLHGARPTVIVLALALALVMPLVGVTGGGPAAALPALACPLEGVDRSLDAADAGSVDNPYVVANKNDLLGIGLCDGVGVHFAQTAHLPLLIDPFTAAPIPGPFLGVFDGAGFEFRDLTITATGAGGPVGLFGEIGASGVVRSVRLVRVAISSERSEVGALAGVLAGGAVALDVSASGAVTMVGDHVDLGGLIGRAGADSEIVSAEFTGAVRATGDADGVGGIVGTTSGEMFQARFEGTVAVEGSAGTGHGAGGIVGVARLADLVALSVEGDVDSTGSEVGGVVGDLVGSTLLFASASGEVTAAGPHVGGIAGRQGPTGVTADDDGRHLYVDAVSFTGLVEGGDRAVGGIVGSVDSASVGGATVDADVRSVRGDAGGIVGFAQDVSIDQTHFVGTVDVTGGPGVAGEAFAGGTAGRLIRGFITESSVQGAVTSTGPQTGGIAGEVREGGVVNASARVTVNGSGADVGGLVGRVVGAEARNGMVVNAWASATSDGSTFIGPIGSLTPPATFLGLFAEADAPETTLTGALRTGAQLRSIATYTDLSDGVLGEPWPIVAGWTASVMGGPRWGICPEVEDGYPFLLWRFETDPCGTTVVPQRDAPDTGPALSCGELPVRVGAEVTCAVTGGPADGVILWRAAYNPVFAEAGMTLGADGSGSFTFVVPAAALGSPVSVELVDWRAPLLLGVAGGPVPTGVPAGGGPTDAPLTTALGVALLGVVLVASRRRGFTRRA